MHNPESVLENETHRLPWDFEIHLNSARRPDKFFLFFGKFFLFLLIIILTKTKRTCRIVVFAVSADYRVKLKKSEKQDKYLDLTRELKKLWNMKVTVIPIVIGALSTVTNGLVQRLEDLEIRRRVETIQTTALLGSARILRRVLETCCNSNSSDRPSANTDVKNSQGVK